MGISCINPEEQLLVLTIGQFFDFSIWMLLPDGSALWVSKVFISHRSSNFARALFY